MRSSGATSIKKIQVLSGSRLKMIAVITMLIDHTATAVLWNDIIQPNIPLTRGSELYHIYQVYRIMRDIGRCAFPIFCFMLVEGFRYTHDRKKYAIRMLIFAFLSEIPFDLGLFGEPFYWQHQNVMFTLFLGLMMMMTWEELEETAEKRAVRIPLQFLSALGWGLIAWLLKTDYDYKGIALILVFYLFRYTRLTQIVTGALVTFWEWPAVLTAFPLLLLYNGKRGRGHKYFFYLFYPVHLLLLFFFGMIFS